MTNGEMLDALDEAGYPLKSIEETGNPLASFWVKVTFHVRGTMDQTRVFHDCHWANCFATAYRKLVPTLPGPPKLNDPSLGDDEPEILVNGQLYRLAKLSKEP